MLQPLTSSESPPSSISTRTAHARWRATATTMSAASRAASNAAETPPPSPRHDPAEICAGQAGCGHDAERDAEVAGAQPHGVVDARDHAEIDRYVERLSAGACRLESFAGDSDDAGFGDVGDRGAPRLQSITDAARTSLLGTAAFADHNEVARLDHAKLESLRPPGGGATPRLHLEVEARREGDHPKTPLKLPGKHLQGGYRHRRVAAEEQRHRAGREHVGEVLVGAHEGGGQVGSIHRDVAVIDHADARLVPCRRQPARIALRGGSDRRRGVAPAAERQTHDDKVGAQKSVGRPGGRRHERGCRRRGGRRQRGAGSARLAPESLEFFAAHARLRHQRRVTRCAAWLPTMNGGDLHEAFSRGSGRDRRQSTPRA